MVLRLTLLIFLIFCSGLLCSQTTKYVSDEYYVQHYTDESGLPQNTVNDLALGDNGEVWFETSAGLVEFDGAEFKVWDKNMLGSPTSTVHDFFRFPSTNLLFIVSDDDGYIKISGGNVDFIKGSRPYFLALTDPPNIKGFNYNGRKYYLHFGFNSTYSDPFKVMVAFPAVGSGLYILREDSIFFSNHNEIVWGAKVHFPYDYLALGRKLYYWDYINPMLSFDHSGNVVSHSMEGVKRIIYNRPERQVFFLDLNNDLHRFYEDGHKQFLMHVEESFGLRSALCLDDETILLGSGTDGLLVCRKKKFKSLGLGHAVDNVYYALRAYDDTSVLASNGVIVGRTGSVKRFRKIKYDENLAMNMIGVDVSGNYYFNHPDHGISRYGNDGSTYDLIPFLGLKSAVTISENDKGMFWFSGLDSTLYSFNGESVETKVHINSLINCIYLLSKNHLLLGCGEGVFIYNKKTMGLFLLPPTQGINVRSISKQRSGKIYITTFDDGIFVFDGKEIIKLPLDENNFLRTTHCVIGDKNGMLWITSNKGLFCIPESEIHHKTNGAMPYYYVGKENGLETNEFNGGCYPCGVYLKNGEIAFPSLKGIAWFDPNTINFRFPKNRPALNKVVLNDKIFEHKGDSLSFERDIRRLELYFVLPFYGDRKNVFLEYNYGDDPTAWYPTKIETPIVLSYLQPGFSTLRVRVRTGFYASDFNYCTLILYRKPALWETIYIWPVLLLSAIGLFYGLLKLNTYRLKRRNKQLQIAIDEAQATIRKNVEELSETNRQLLQKSRFHNWLISSIVHDIKGPLQFLVDYGDLYDHSGTPDKIEVRFLRSAFTTSKKIYEYADRLIQVLLTQQDGSMKPETIDVKEVVGDLIKKFQPLIEEKGIVVETDLSDPIQQINGIAFRIIIHNILDNSIKHQQGGVIRIRSFSEDGMFALSFSDEGKGIPEKLLDVLNNVDNEIPNTGRSGLGVGLIFSMLRQTDGTVRFQNTDAGLNVEIRWIRR